MFHSQKTGFHLCTTEPEAPKTISAADTDILFALGVLDSSQARHSGREALASGGDTWGYRGQVFSPFPAKSAAHTKYPALLVRGLGQAVCTHSWLNSSLQAGHVGGRRQAAKAERPLLSEHQPRFKSCFDTRQGDKSE